MKKLYLLLVAILSLTIVACSSTTDALPSEETQDQGKAQNQQTKSDFPNKPIELIVPYAPGGTTDIAARALASVMSKYLPNEQPVVVVNKPGASGTIGLSEVFQAKPDGYTLGMTSTTATSIQPHYGSTVFTHDSFQPIVRVLSVPQLLGVKSDAPWQTFEEWLDYVKQNPDTFTYSVPTKGGSQYLAMEALSAATGIKVKAVPFDGAAPAVTALLGGHVQGIVVQVQDAKTQIDAGTIRPLVNVGGTKIDAFKDLPLLREKNIDVAFDIYTGVLAPKGLPQDVLDILHNAFKQALEDPSVIEQLQKIGVEPEYAGPEDFQKDITDSFYANGEVMKKVGLIH